MGKSSAVQMLCAYYDKTCDFDDNSYGNIHADRVAVHYEIHRAFVEFWICSKDVTKISFYNPFRVI